MKTIIYLMGTDGSGKTTNAMQLVKEGFPGLRMEYIYSQYRPLIIMPLKLVAKLFFQKKETLFGDYKSYSKKKKEYTKKLKLLTRIYCLIWYLDHVIQIWIKLFLVRIKKPDIIVIDRYYLDSIVNLACLQNFNNKQMLADARMIENLLPKANYHFFLDVDEDKAFKRKDDIPSTDYLCERKKRYKALAPLYDFQVINANSSQKIVYTEFKNKIARILKK